MNKRAFSLYNIVLTSIFTAIITATAYFFKLPLPNLNGYIHLGDAMVFISACILPAPLAVFSASVGSALSDFFGGYTIYVVPTLIIKALLVLSFSRKEKKIVCKKNLFALLICTLVSVAGYFVADTVIMYFSMSVAQIKYAVIASLSNMPWNFLQAICSAVVFIVFATSLDKIQIKSKINGGKR